MKGGSGGEEMELTGDDVMDDTRRCVTCISQAPQPRSSTHNSSEQTYSIHQDGGPFKLFKHRRALMINRDGHVSFEFSELMSLERSLSMLNLHVTIYSFGVRHASSNCGCSYASLEESRQAEKSTCLNAPREPFAHRRSNSDVPAFLSKVFHTKKSTTAFVLIKSEVRK